MGTAISLLVRRGPATEGSGGARSVSFRDLWGPEKRAMLLAEARTGSER